LIELEYNRLVTFLPDFLDEVRSEQERLHTAAPLKLRAAASESIASELDRFLSDTLHANPGMYDTEKVLHVQTQLNTLQALQTALTQFASDFIVIPQHQRPRLAEHMIEGLHAILMVAADMPSDASGESQAMLAILTQERSSLMERVRAEVLGGFADIAGREAMLSATLTFERIIWLLRRL
jgi:hypothetical protein